MRGIVGLDFGTTNTLCAWMDGDAPIVVPNDRGERATPSVAAVPSIAATPSGDPGAALLVGSSARNQALADPESAVFGVKRLLGKSAELRIGSLSMSPEDVAAAILRKVRADAESYLGFDVTRAVITVPARFGDPQRRAVREAARRAGLEASRVMNEPSAAALARAWLAAKDGDERLVLVYDFGGGTFDATVLRAKGGRCTVLSSEGDDALGGMDLDAALYGEVALRFREDFGIEANDDPLLARTLMDLCEKAKIELSTRDEATVAVPFLRGAGGIVHPSVRIRRERLDQLIEPFVGRSLSLVARVLGAAGAAPEDVDALVLSGGSSRIPLARSRLADYLGREADPRINPEEIVALGAAVEAARIEGRLSGLEFTDVCSRTFGLELDDGSFVPLIRKNSPLPAVGRRLFTTVEDFQRSVELHVLQGDGAGGADAVGSESGSASGSPNGSGTEGVDASVSVGRFLLPGIRRARRGEPRIAVEFSIDEGDMLMVRAKDLDTGAEQSVSVVGGAYGTDGIAGDAEGSDGGGRSPRDKALVMARIVLREAAGLTVDAALGAEIAELTDKAQSPDIGDDEAAAVALLLEGLAADLAARRGGATSEPSLRRFDAAAAPRAAERARVERP